jgi:hypothetical protein
MDWKIERIRDRCSACSKPFAHDQRVTSLVELDASERVVRRDVCASCRPAGDASVVWWETRFEVETSSRRKVDFDRLLRIFEAWHAAPPAGLEALLYLVSLLLVRKRFLRIVELTTVDGREMLSLRRPGPAGRSYLAPAPLLSPADLPQLRARLEELIDGSFADDEMPANGDAAAAAG